MDDRSDPIRVIVGLGNPGNEHQSDRHNAGFWFLDRLAGRLGSVFQTEARFFGDLGRVRVGQAGHLWLLKPGTYMNRSGEAVVALCNYYRINVAQVLIVHDELDLMPGTARLKFGGSSAGHRGLKDISERVGGQAYWRLRLGIGHPRRLDLRQEVASFVLHRPCTAHQSLIEGEIERAIDLLPLLAEGAFPEAMRRMHRRPSPPGEPPAHEMPPNEGPSN